MPCQAAPVAPAKADKTPAPVQEAVPDFGVYGYPYLVQFHSLKCRGTLLTYIKPGSIAAKCGLKADDIVYRINNHTTSSPRALNAIVRSYEGMPKRIDYFRSNGKGFSAKEANTNEVRVFRDRTGNVVKRATQAEMEDYLITLVNADRSKKGLSGSLKKSSALSRMARSYADDMAKRDFKGHRDPEGRDPWARAKLAGISSNRIFENCAYPFPEANSLTMVYNGERQLMDSPEHSVSILQPDNVCVGCGIAYRKDGGLMIVQVFSPDNIP